jgi:hypothetical protein
MQEAAAARRPYQFEYALRHADGSERFVWEQGQAVFSAEDELVAFEGFISNVTARKRAEALLDAQKHSLELVVSGAPLRGVLTHLAEIVERQAGGGVVAGILLLDEQGRLRDGAAPSLPAEYVNAIDGLTARADLGTCSAAAVTGEVVITPDIDADEKRIPSRTRAHLLGRAACGVSCTAGRRPSRGA